MVDAGGRQTVGARRYRALQGECLKAATIDPYGECPLAPGNESTARKDESSPVGGAWLVFDVTPHLAVLLGIMNKMIKTQLSSRFVSREKQGEEMELVRAQCLITAPLNHEVIKWNDAILGINSNLY